MSKEEAAIENEIRAKLIESHNRRKGISNAFTI